MRDIFIPATGMARDDVVVQAWLKQPGDRLTAGDVVATVETAKAVLEVTADEDGVLGPHLVQADETVAPGSTIAQLLQDGDSVTAPEEEPRHRVSPRARRLASEAPAPVPPPARREDPPPPPVRHETPTAPPPDRARAAIAAAVSTSWREIPHFAVTRQIEVDDLVRRYRTARELLPGVTLTDLLLRAAALAFLGGAAAQSLDLGLAVDTDRGVVLPVIRDVPGLSLRELIAARLSAVERARSGTAHPDDGLRPVTTVSNLGALGVDEFTGIIPVGQDNLLTVGRIAERAVVQDGALRAATTVRITLVADHRVRDGADCARLLARLATALRAPDALLAVGPLPAG